jgi:hypothetical protein
MAIPEHQSEDGPESATAVGGSRLVLVHEAIHRFAVEKTFAVEPSSIQLHPQQFLQLATEEPGQRNREPSLAPADELFGN